MSRLILINEAESASEQEVFVLVIREWLVMKQNKGLKM